MRNPNNIIFVTGNSRSGTTLMMRLLNNHSEVHAINEPHFFESMWSNSDKGKIISYKQSKDLLNQLIVRQREGFFKDPEDFIEKYESEVKRLLQEKENWTKELIYSDFITYETYRNSKKIPCEKTPQNVFYIREILDLFPNALIINMIRDPRDVLLSQKMKWQRPKLGAGFMTKKEVNRLKINYHPITISKLWNSAISAYQKHIEDSRVIGVKFEDLIADTPAILTTICNKVGLTYQADMLKVPFAGSSTEMDSSNVGIRDVANKTWIEKGLNHSEISICQRLCENKMVALGYHLIEVKNDLLRKTGYYISFPFKVFLALCLNLNRMRSIKESLTKRMQNS